MKTLVSAALVALTATATAAYAEGNDLAKARLKLLDYHEKAELIKYAQQVERKYNGTHAVTTDQAETLDSIINPAKKLGREMGRKGDVSCMKAADDYLTNFRQSDLLNKLNDGFHKDPKLKDRKDIDDLSSDYQDLFAQAFELGADYVKYSCLAVKR